MSLAPMLKYAPTINCNLCKVCTLVEDFLQASVQVNTLVDALSQFKMKLLQVGKVVHHCKSKVVKIRSSSGDAHFTKTEQGDIEPGYRMHSFTEKPHGNCHKQVGKTAEGKCSDAGSEISCHSTEFIEVMLIFRESCVVFTNVGFKCVYLTGRAAVFGRMGDPLLAKNEGPLVAAVLDGHHGGW
jgi:hypothetical protein